MVAVQFATCYASSVVGRLVVARCTEDLEEGESWLVPLGLLQVIGSHITSSLNGTIPTPLSLFIETETPFPFLKMNGE